ncbi:MAG TPA: PA2169 family four-helix-bundle protein [Chthoniobacteraceae bacterium]|jgi:uncharacterized protein (TIGR02284 family)
MTTTNRNLASTLNSLIETCKDGQEGFRIAAEDVKNSALKSLFAEYSLQRSQFSGELQELVRSLGESSEKQSSVMGAMHRGWINIKAALSSGDEHAVLSECERGEDSAVAEYHEALEQDLPANVREVLQRQSIAVRQVHDHVRDLRDGKVS